jgi:hypothetical protein
MDGEKYVDAAQGTERSVCHPAGFLRAAYDRITKAAGLSLHGIARRRDGWGATQKAAQLQRNQRNAVKREKR